MRVSIHALFIERARRATKRRRAGLTAGKNVGARLFDDWSLIRKSGNRFSEKITPRQKGTAPIDSI
jgi:hypothetical protein